MSKFSVRKPLTVLVSVVLVVVLGIVSFTNMSTDLLPSLELPYVIAVTTCPGASPEKVEQTVTKPMESALATTSGVKNVTSVSNENMSMVVLEFEQGQNMDAAMIEMDNTVSTVSAQLDDTVGAPILMQISPDMLPVMVAGVDREGMDEKELSAYINETLLPEFERIDGVASVSAVGLVEEQITVTLKEKKIDKINNKLLKTVNSELYDAGQQIEDGLKQIEDGRKKLDDGKAELSTQQDKGAASLAAASAQVDAAVANLQAILSEETILESNKKAFETERTAMQQLQQAKPSLDQLASGIVQAAFAAKLPTMSTPPTAEEMTEATKVQTEMQTALQDPARYIKDNLTDKQFANLYKAVIEQAPKDTVPDTMKNLDRKAFLSTLEQAGNAGNRIDEINTELSNISTRLTVVQAMKPELEKAQKQAEDGYKELESQKITAIGGMTDGSIKLSETEQSLNSAEEKLKDAQNEFKASREQALSKANLGELLTADTINGLLTAQNFSMPAGTIEEDGMEQHVIKVGDTYSSVKELRNTLLTHIDQGDIGDVYLKDIADVKLTDNAGESYARLNGNPAIILSFQKQSTASTSAVSDAINEKIESLQETESGLQILPLMDQGNYIHIVVNSVVSNLLWGALLAILVLAIFLRDVKPTLIIACSIPISLLFAIVLMYFTNVTLNLISLSGLALGVGMLVDNSVVVIENIYRLRGLGLSPIKAAVKGAKEVSGALAASTLTTICVFMPIVFTEGISRQLFTDMGLTIAYSLAASLVVALTVVPAMGATVLRKTNSKSHKLFEAFTNLYEKVLRFSLRRRAVVLIAVVLLLAFSVFEATRMGTAFIPESETSQIQATLEATDEDTTKADFRKTADAILEKMEAVEGVQTVGAMENGGSGMLSMGGGNSMSFYILLDPDRKADNQTIEAQLTKAAEDTDCELTVSGSGMDMSALGGSGLEVVVKGAELETIYEIADDLAEKLGDVEGLTEISNGREDAASQTVITVDKKKAMREGLTVAQIYQSLAGDLSSETNSTSITVGGTTYPIVIESPTKITRKNLMDYELTSTDATTGETKTVTLGDIATDKETESPLTINRENAQRTLSVTAQVDDDHNIGLISRDVEKMLEDYDLPDGYTVEIQGENEQINDAMQDMLLMLLLAVLFIYLIMVAQFQSFVSPFIVILTIPLAITGGLLALWITGSELSVIAMIGFLVLAGVVVNNGIVFVDYVNRLRVNGMEKREALITTGRTRLRPILMTALTTILAMVTMAMGIGEGADMTAPVGIVVIGGLSYATVLTLIVVPVLYDLFSRKTPRDVSKELEELDALED